MASAIAACDGLACALLSRGGRPSVSGRHWQLRKPGRRSFSIGTGDPPSKYFAYVEIDTSAGVARGYWNGTAGASHAHEDLGSLVREGPYWVNDRAKVYASC